MTKQESTEHGNFSTQHIPTGAVASSIGGRLIRVNEDPITRRLELTFHGVPRDLLERIIADEIHISAKRMLASLEEMHALLLQYRRRR
jgi:hypothetical protein